MNKLLKLILIVILALYIISPADFAIGPADDVIILLGALAANKFLNNRKAQRQLPESEEELIEEDSSES